LFDSLKVDVDAMDDDDDDVDTEDTDEEEDEVDGGGGDVDAGMTGCMGDDKGRSADPGFLGSVVTLLARRLFGLVDSSTLGEDEGGSRFC
jgi:hypothetical protein